MIKGSLNNIFIILFFLIRPAGAEAQVGDALRSLHHNNDGVKKIEQENELAAEQSLLQSMADDPSNPIPHMNLGWVYEVSKKYEKAIKEYELVLRYQNLPEDLTFAAHFNAGNASAKNENIELALQHYQEALLIRPDSVEVKTNIELLFKGGGGQGKGKNKDNKKNKDGQGEGGEQGQNEEPQKDQEPRPQEKPKFKDEKLTKEDVRRILEELKAQEQKIRALEYGAKTKEKPSEKDW